MGVAVQAGLPALALSSQPARGPIRLVLTWLAVSPRTQMHAHVPVSHVSPRRAPHKAGLPLLVALAHSTIHRLAALRPPALHPPPLMTAPTAVASSLVLSLSLSSSLAVPLP